MPIHGCSSSRLMQFDLVSFALNCMMLLLITAGWAWLQILLFFGILMRSWISGCQRLTRNGL
eukprot:5888513-Amphidinium_carterae.1